MKKVYRGSSTSQLELLEMQLGSPDLVDAKTERNHTIDPTSPHILSPAGHARKLVQQTRERFAEHRQAIEG